MQVVAHTTDQDTHTRARWIVSGQVAAVFALLLASAALRLLGLGAVPLSAGEIQPALAAYRDAWAGAAGESATANAPLLYWMQRIDFMTMGGGELSARIGTALAGIALGLSPLLFRDLLGWPRAFLFALLLTLSPVLLIASRLGGPAIWSALLAVVMLWAGWRWWQTHKQAYGVGATVALAALLLLSEPGGPLLALILLGAGAAALSLMALKAPDDEDLSGDDYALAVRERLQGWPWRFGGLVAGLVVVVVSTGFMLHPGGLAMVGALLEGLATGFVRGEPGAPLFHPLQTALFYETWLWPLALMALLVLRRRESFTVADRFLTAWLVLGLAAALIFQGGRADHALWLTIPLAGLVAFLAADALTRHSAPTLWLDGLLDDDELNANSARWGKWLLALLTFVLLTMAALHLHAVSRGFVTVSDGSLSAFFGALGTPAFANVVNGLTWLVISILFLVVGYFMAASIWGNVMPARAGVIGLLVFALVTSLGSGWRAAQNVHDPREPWHVQGVSDDALMLRQTVLELASRATQNFPDLSISVMGESESVVGWLLREFNNTTYVDSIPAARGDQLVLIPASALETAIVDELDLGASYVGQPISVARDWSAADLRGFDFLAWWSMRHTRTQPRPAEPLVLWVRQDIYDAQPFQGQP